MICGYDDALYANPVPRRHHCCKVLKVNLIRLEAESVQPEMKKACFFPDLPTSRTRDSSSPGVCGCGSIRSMYSGLVRVNLNPPRGMTLIAGNSRPPKT